MPSSRHRPTRRALFAYLGTGVAVAAAACSTGGGTATRGDSLGTAKQDLSATNFFGTTLPAKTLALTFDDGPGARTAELSMYLKAQNIKAAFFVNGGLIQATTLPNPNGLTPIANVNTIMAQIVTDGHLVSNHTTTHRDLVNTVLPTGAAKLVQELTETDTAIAGRVPSGYFLFRAPFGSYNGAVYDGLKTSAMNKYIGPIYWDIGDSNTNYPNGAADWACWSGQQRNAVGGGLTNGTGYATTAQCGDAYINEINAVGRGIVLMHDPYSWANGSTVDMIKYMVPLLKAAGYSFVRIDDVPSIKAALPPCDATCKTCDGVNATQCTTCNTGRYYAGGPCTLCSTCGAAEYVETACTPTANTACGTCDASCTNCTGPTATACSACPTSAYLSAGACKACSVCPAGQFLSAACTATANTACSPCAAGTYSAAGATACTACGSCDDANPCTTDTCDPTKGCAHEAIPGCGSSSSSSGATSSGATSSGATSSGGSGSGGGDDSGCAVRVVKSTSSGGSGSRGGLLLLLGLAIVPLARRGARAERGLRAQRPTRDQQKS